MKSFGKITASASADTYAFAAKRITVDSRKLHRVSVIRRNRLFPLRPSDFICEICHLATIVLPMMAILEAAHRFFFSLPLRFI